MACMYISAPDLEAANRIAMQVRIRDQSERKYESIYYRALLVVRSVDDLGCRGALTSRIFYS
jgi:hypothetical protein